MIVHLGRAHMPSREDLECETSWFDARAYTVNIQYAHRASDVAVL